MAQIRRGDMDGSVEATRVLRDLLAAKPNYRKRWQQHAHRRRTEEVSQAAVAQVLALYLWDSGERDDADTDLARSLRHRVRRAFSGEQLTGETLTWFVEAFEMTRDDEQRLWHAFSGGGVHAGGISHTLTTPQAFIKPQLHRTVSLFERYEFDEHHTLVSRHTLHVIRAVEADLQCYPFVHEALASRVEVVAGGELGPEHTYGASVLSEILLPKVLKKGDATALEYRTFYVPNCCPSEVRRVVRGRCENLDFAVQFSQSAIPASVTFCIWTDPHTGLPASTEEAELDMNGFAHRFVPFAEQAVLGFSWDWASSPNTV
jgi:hypothetical protein